MKKIVYASVIFFSMLDLACKNSTMSQEMPQEESIQPMEFFGISLDSVLSKEQQKLLTKLQRVVVEYVSFVDGKMECRLEKEDFEKLGIPVSYYVKLEKELKINNQWIQQCPDIDWEKSFNVMKEQMKKELEKK